MRWIVAASDRQTGARKARAFSLMTCIAMMCLVVYVACPAADGEEIVARGGVAASATGEQFLRNGDMEQDGGWQITNGGKGTLPKINEQTFDDKHSGKTSRHIVITREGREWPNLTSASFATETGKTYEVRFWYKALKGGFSVLVRNGAGNDYLRPKPSVMCVPRYEMTNKHLVWTEYVGAYTEENGGENAYLRFGIGSSNYPSGRKQVEFYLDDVSVREIDVSVESALKKWRKLFPERNYICWEKSPWDNLLPVQFPPAAPRECERLSVTMGQNEYESCSFVVTNLSDSEKDVDVSLKNPTIRIVLRQAMWVTDYDGAKINDALPLLEGSLAIPSGESREVWLTIHTRDQEAGDYEVPIEVASQDGLVTIPLDVKVHPVTLRDDMPLYTYYWDYIVPESSGPELTQALVEDMKRHYVNVPVVHPWPARMQFDSAGKLKANYTDLDKTLDAYRLLDPKMLLFFWNAEAYLEAQDDFSSDEWKLRFKAWLTDLVRHLKEKGWGYDKFAMNPYDESLRPAVCAMVKLIKEIDPEIIVYVNSTGEGVSTEQDVRNIAPYVDIWNPFLYDYLNRPPYDRSFEVKEVAVQVFRKQVADEFFWTYANPLVGRPKSASPYRDYRLPLWQTWELGMRGFGYWVYAYKTHWNSHKHKDGAGWAVVYLANAADAPPGISQKELVVPSKRWEATREGVEDYVYLYMLREAVREAEKRGVHKQALDNAKTVLLESPKSVLEDETNPALADAAKESIIKAIVTLSTEQD